MENSEEIEQYKNNPSSMYSSRFFRKGQRMRRWQSAYAKCLVELYPDIKSVVDFGCASGFMMEGVIEAGVDKVKGYEYMLENSRPYIREDLVPLIEKGNLMESIECDKYDMVMSVEVAEHLLPERTDVFIRNLTNTSNKYIFLTAAPPGQKGTGHINCRPRKFWIQALEDNGFAYRDDEVVRIREALAKLPVRIRQYMFRNVMFFTKNQKG